ncbi:MAG: response regulator [Gammaproteobacteria bacterium]|nr:response regulator [Gammaproteobacteria bacterium]
MPTSADHSNNTERDSSTKIALIVEDDPTFQSSLLQCVSQLGEDWQATVCSNGSQVIAALSSQLPNIAIALVDLGLPDRSGIKIID